MITAIACIDKKVITKVYENFIDFQVACSIDEVYDKRKKRKHGIKTLIIVIKGDEKDEI